MGDGELQRAVLPRNLWNISQVVSKDACCCSPAWRRRGPPAGPVPSAPGPQVSSSRGIRVQFTDELAAQRPHVVHVFHQWCLCVCVSLNRLAFAVVDSAMPISEIGLSLLVHQEVDVSVCREFVRIETIDSGSTYSRTIPCRISIFTSLVTRATTRPFRSGVSRSTIPTIGTFFLSPFLFTAVG